MNPEIDEIEHRNIDNSQENPIQQIFYANKAKIRVKIRTSKFSGKIFVSLPVSMRYVRRSNHREEHQTTGM